MYDTLVEAHGEDNPVFLSSFMEAATPPPAPKEEKDKNTSSAVGGAETPRSKRRKTDHGSAASSSLAPVASMAGTMGNQQVVKNTPKILSTQPNGIETQSAQDNALTFPLTAPEGPASRRESMGQRGVRNRGARDEDNGSDVEEIRKKQDRSTKGGVRPSGNGTRLLIDSDLSD
ncbi:hypothetical protein EX30DRAFT_338720 [Ascodesmis nigricans]|uniref:Uncharacterized protein n=1 Tax=Ascodesmis nigricans TaxID=341454 RepID=A0A4S2N4P7_9PEZI|nr:hypothetical protein EX30DRAFT_338720 [Ascodesmis nigricans]